MGKTLSDSGNGLIFTIFGIVAVYTIHCITKSGYTLNISKDSVQFVPNMNEKRGEMNE